MNIARILLIIAALTEMHGVSGQIKILPGDKSLRYDLIKEYPTEKIRYKMISIDSTGLTLSVSESENSVYEEPSKNVIVRIQKRYLGNRGVLIDSTFANARTLAPLRMSMTTEPHSMSMNLQFQQTQVKAKADMNGQKTDATHEVKEPYFDSNLLDVLIGLLPYKKDYSAVINTYTFERKGIDSYQIQYLSDDVLFAGTTPVVCSQVEVMPLAAKGKGFPGYRYWIEKKSGIVTKMLIPGQNKSYWIVVADWFYRSN